MTSYAINCTVVSCTVQNTLVTGSSTALGDVGGIVGTMYGGNICSSYQLGFSSNSSQYVVYISNNTNPQGAGAIVGYCYECRVSQCGTEKGTIYSLRYSSGLVGFSDGSCISQSYVSSHVCIQGLFRDENFKYRSHFFEKEKVLLEDLLELPLIR